MGGMRGKLEGKRWKKGVSSPFSVPISSLQQQGKVTQDSSSFLNTQHPLLLCSLEEPATTRTYPLSVGVTVLMHVTY